MNPRHRGPQRVPHGGSSGADHQPARTGRQWLHDDADLLLVRGGSINLRPRILTLSMSHFIKRIGRRHASLSQAIKFLLQFGQG